MFPRWPFGDRVEGVDSWDHVDVHMRLGVAEHGVVEAIRRDGVPDGATHACRSGHKRTHRVVIEVMEMFGVLAQRHEAAPRKSSIVVETDDRDVEISYG